MRENNLPVVALGSAAAGIRTQVHVIQKKRRSSWDKATASAADGWHVATAV